MGSYVVAKSALKSLLSICSAEYSWLKVRTVSPGFTKTPMLDVFDPRYPEMVHARKPILAPEEVALDILEQIDNSNIYEKLSWLEKPPKDFAKRLKMALSEADLRGFVAS